MARLETGLEVLLAVEHLHLDTRVLGDAGKMDIVVEVLHFVSLRYLRRSASSSTYFPACPPASQACCPSSRVVEERDEQE